MPNKVAGPVFATELVDLIEPLDKVVRKVRGAQVGGSRSSRRERAQAQLCQPVILCGCGIEGRVRTPAGNTRRRHGV